MSDFKKLGVLIYIKYSKRIKAYLKSKENKVDLQLIDPNYKRQPLQKIMSIKDKDRIRAPKTKRKVKFEHEQKSENALDQISLSD